MITRKDPEHPEPRARRPGRRARSTLIRRTLFGVSAAAWLWSAILALTGGFHIRIGSVPISSRGYWNALAIALLAAAAAEAVTWRLGGWPLIRNDWVSLTRGIARGIRRMTTVVSAWASSLRAQVAAAAAGAREHEPWLALAPAIAIGIAAAALTIVQWAGARPLWVDEEMLLLNVRDRSWFDLGGQLWLGQSAPLAWLVFERAALAAFGAGEAALRLQPVLFGLGTIAASLWIGHRWMTSLGSAVLVLLCAFGPWFTHFFFEAKHYSADTFFALLLPALAVWATEGDRVETRASRALIWWIAAGAGQTLANGALLVAPGCALFLVASAWRRDGRRAALHVAAAGIVWLAAFAAHYQLALRSTHESEYLRDYWANEVPPAAAGPVERARWIAARFQPLAVNPAGTESWKTLWICAPVGLAIGRRRGLGLAFATAPLAAFVLAALRLVPLYERFSLWIVPALYIGLAMGADAVVSALRYGYRTRRWSPALVAAPLLFACLAVTADIYRRGIHAIANRPTQHNHSLNDRFAVEWLVTRVRPGDAVMTTRLGWPAIWWYGGIPIAHADSSGVVRHPNGVALLEVEHREPEECDDDRLREDLAAYRRVLVYIGFPDYPQGFDYLLLHTLDGMGAIKAFSRYSDRGLAAVIDLEDPSAGDLTLPVVSPKTVETRVPVEGCVRTRPARRW